MNESKIIKEYESAKTYEEQQEVISKTENPGKTRYMLIQKGIYQKKMLKASEEKKAIINAFEIIVGKAMPSLGNMTIRDLKTLWSFVIKENNRYESGD